MPRENKEEQIYTYIKTCIKQEGFSPSVREICDAVGLSSPSTVHGYLKRLEQKGMIIKDDLKKRAIRLPDWQESIPDEEVVSVPLVGTVAAGMPILAQENIIEHFPLPIRFAKNHDLFMLRVKGESMINAGILDGDYVIVERRQTAENGQMVVALLEDSATVKTFYREKDCIRLQPENDTLEPIYTKEIAILGVVKGVFRTY